MTRKYGNIEKQFSIASTKNQEQNPIIKYIYSIWILPLGNKNMSNSME